MGFRIIPGESGEILRSLAYSSASLLLTISFTSHAKHHASTGHMTQDQVFVPKTRSSLNLPPLDPTREDIAGEHVSKEVMAEMWEALGDSPISAAMHGLSKCVGLHMHVGS